MNTVGIALQDGTIPDRLQNLRRLRLTHTFDEVLRDFHILVKAREYLAELFIGCLEDAERSIVGAVNDLNVS